MNANEIRDIIETHNLNISLCSDGFYIVESWSDVNKLEAYTHDSIDNVLKEWGFSDECSMCDNCLNSIHTQSYDMKDYSIIDNNIICGDCIRDSNNDYYKDYIKSIINNPKSANTILKDNFLENIGFIKCNCNNQDCNFANGLHIGDNDDPKTILKNAIAKNPDKDFIFDITNVDMFTTNFTIWSKSKNQDMEDD